MISMMSTAILCRQQDVIQLFVLLKKEKRLLLLQQADIQQPQHQKQFREQMNDLNRQLHAVVQRMSARQRYKRRKTKPIRLTSVQASARLVMDDIMTRLKAVHTSQLAIIEDLRGDRTMYSELADMLEAGTIANDRIGEAQQQQTDTRELSESEQFRQSMRDQVLGVMRSSRERQTETERSCREEQERDRLKQERRQKQQAEAEERDRLRQERRRQEQAEAEERERLYQARLEEKRAQSAERAEQKRLRWAQIQERLEECERKDAEELARLSRQMAKRQENGAWRLKWLQQLGLVYERRANNSANAG